MLNTRQVEINMCKYMCTEMTELIQEVSAQASSNTMDTNLRFSLLCEGKSRLEYCFDNADRSPSPFPRPPLAGSNVGLAAVVIFPYVHRHIFHVRF